MKDKASVLSLGSLLAFSLSSPLSVSLSLVLSLSSHSLSSPHALSPLCLLHTLCLFLLSRNFFLAVSLVIVSPFFSSLLTFPTLSCLPDVCSSLLYMCTAPFPITSFPPIIFSIPLPLHVSTQVECVSVLLTPSPLFHPSILFCLLRSVGLVMIYSLSQLFLAHTGDIGNLECL